MDVPSAPGVAIAAAGGHESGMNEPRVLVIDDDDDIRGLVAELLQRAGLEVDQAPDGRAGLRAFHQSPADLIVLDVSMPELDGWETLERIRDLSDVPVIMLTARGAELERVRGLQAGADDYIVKPFGRQELVARVQALLRRARPSGADRQETCADGRITIALSQPSVTYHGPPSS